MLSDQSNPIPSLSSISIENTDNNATDQHVDQLRVELSQVKDINNKDANGATLLHKAIKSNNFVKVKLLIEEHGADIDSGDRENITPLCLAAKYNNVDVLSYLLSHNVDVLKVSSDGRNVLHHAVLSGDAELVEILLKHINDYQCNKLLNGQDDDSKFPIHCAALQANPEIIKLLCAAGAEVNAKNDYGYTALHLASKSNNYADVLQQLIVNGANVNAINVNGDTSLFLALQSGNQMASMYLNNLELNKVQDHVDMEVLELLKRGNTALCELDNSEAMKHYGDALRCAESEEDYLGLCFTMIKIGDQLLLIKDPKRAAHYYTSASLISDKHPEVQKFFNSKYFDNKQFSLEVKFIRDQRQNDRAIPTTEINVYRHILQAAREQIENSVSFNSNDMHTIMHSTATTMKDMLSDLLRDSMEMMGKPLCRYAVIGLGSMARGEMCPYSDIEFAILVGERTSQVVEYFQQLSQLIELKIIALGETEFPILNSTLARNGFCFDSSNNPISNESFTNTPKSMAKVQLGTARTADVVTMNVLRTVCFVHGDNELLKEYEKLLAQTLISKRKVGWLQSSDLTIGQEHALKLLKGDLEDFKPDLEKESHELHFNAKKELYRLPSSFASHMALWCNLTQKNSWERLDQLRCLGFINAAECSNLKLSLTIATAFRTKAQLHYCYENDDIYHAITHAKEKQEARVFYVLKPEEERMLTESYRVLMPLHSAIKKFVARDGMYRFINDSFYSDDPHVDGQGLERMGRYREAIVSYQKAMQLRPEDIEIQISLLKAKIHNHDYLGLEELAKNAFDHACKRHGSNHVSVISIQYMIAYAKEVCESYDEAIETYNKILSHKGNAAEITALLKQSYSGVIRINIKQKAYEKAEEVSKELIVWNEKQYGKQSLEVGDTITQLAEIYKLTQEHEKAEESYKKALEIYSKLLDTEAKTSNVLDSLGDVYFGYGEATKAEDHYSQALVLREKKYGTYSVEAATSCMKFGDVYYSYGQYDKALEFQQRALKIRLKTLGEIHAEVAISYVKITETYRAEADYGKAQEFAEKALSLNVQIYKPKLHKKIKASQPSFTVRAETLRQQLFKDVDKYILHSKIMESCQQLALVHYAAGEIEIAKEYYKIGKSNEEISHSAIIFSLKAHYRKFNKLKRFVTEEECELIKGYINLAVVRQEEIKDKDKEGVKYRDERLHTYEALYTIQEPLNLDKLFESKDNKSQSKVIIYGRAGIGKTTMCKYIVAKWQHGILWQDKFTAILWLPLRELLSYTEVNERPTLSSVIKNKCMIQSRIDVSNIEEFISSHKKKALFILDGYDEVAQVIEKPEYRWLQQIMLELINDQGLHVLLTSRPMKVARVGGEEVKFDQTLENIGFTNDNIENYVMRFNTQHGKEILQFLKGNQSVWGIAHVPINLELICSIWQPGTQQEKLTMTDMYQAITRKLIARYLEKHCGFDIRDSSFSQQEAKAELEISALEQLGLAGMESNQIILSEKLVKETLAKTIRSYKARPLSVKEKKENVDQEAIENLYSKLLQTGIVRLADNSGKRDIHFIHLTFQEYYAASYVAKLFTAKKEIKYSKAQELVERNIFTSYWEVVWWFSGGLFYNHAISTKNNLALDEFWNVINGLKGTKELKIRYRCLEIKLLDESKADSNISIIKQQMNQLKQWAQNYYEEGSRQAREVSQRLVISPHVAQKIVQIFIYKLNSWPKDSRRSAAEALGRIGPAAEAAVPALITTLGDKEWFVRSSAAEALGMIGPAAEAAVPALIAALDDKNDDVRSSAAIALYRIGPAAIPALTIGLGNKDGVVRISAAWALGKIGPAAVPGLITALGDKNDDVRSKAADALGKIGPAAEAAVPDLITALGDKNYNIRSSAAEALGKIGPAAEAAVPDLITALGDDKWNVRRDAAEALGKIGPAAEAAVPDLITALDDKEWYVRSKAAEALGMIGPAAEAAVPDLITALSDKEKYVRRGAAEALGLIGPAAEAAVPALIIALSDKEYDVRRDAAWALGRIGPAAETAVSALITALSDENEWVRSKAAWALGKIGPVRETVIPALITALSDKDMWVRRDAAEALGKIGPAAGAAVPALITALSDKNDNVRSRAAEALGMIAPVAEAAVPALITALSDRDIDVRRYAAEALGKIGPAAEAAVPALITALSDKNDDVRSRAAEALGMIKTEESEQALKSYKAQPLHLASSQGNIAKVKNIIAEQSISVDTPDFNSKTALYLAAENKHWDVVKLLTEKGASVDCLKNLVEVPRHIMTVLTSRASISARSNNL